MQRAVIRGETMHNKKAARIAVVALHALVAVLLVVAWLPLAFELACRFQVVPTRWSLHAYELLSLTVATFVAAMSFWVMRRLLPLRWWLWAATAIFVSDWATWIIIELIELSEID